MFTLDEIFISIYSKRNCATKLFVIIYVNFALRLVVFTAFQITFQNVSCL